jgi:hypothetical protein
MSNHEQRSPDAESGDSLQLNKETLQDLDLEPADEQNVKGGGTSVYYNISASYLYNSQLASVGQSLRSALTSSVPSGSSVSG